MATFTPAEKTFLDRMVPLIMAGDSLREAALKVKQRDEELWLMTMANDEQGAALRSELGKEVYRRIRGS